MNAAAPPPWLALAANLVLPCACTLALSVVWRSSHARARLARYCAALERDLRCLQLRAAARDLIRAQLAALAVVFALGVFTTPWALPFAWLTMLAPKRVLARLRQRRSAQLERQLDGFLLALANQLRANPALGEALRECARLVPRPMADELALVHKETRLGMPLDRALTEMALRVQSPLCSAALASLRVARSTGGDLSQTLEASAASLREMARLEGVVRTKTAEGRAQSLLIGALPVPLMWLLHAVDPQLLAPLFAQALGHVVLALAVGLWVGAVVWANRIVAVDV